jgi:lipoprotein signal peptidase
VWPTLCAGNPSSLTLWLDRISLGVSVVFCVEAVIKFLGLGLSYFFSISNIFDLAIVVGFLIEKLVSSGGSVSALRLLR